jgi:hypothetical protein
MTPFDVDDLRAWLEDQLGTPTFGVEDGSITLRVPEPWPGSAGAGDVINFDILRSWEAAFDAFAPDIGHATGDQSGTALCGALTAAPATEGLVEVTCADCLLRVVAMEVALPPGPSGSRRIVHATNTPTLHAEIARILGQRGGWMTTSELAEAVNEAGRYRKRDGSPVAPLQIHGRTRNYSKLFEREGSRVRLRASGEGDG